MTPTLPVLLRLLAILSESVTASTKLLHEPNELLLEPNDAEALQRRIDECACQTGLASLHMRLLVEGLMGLSQSEGAPTSATEPPANWERVLRAFSEAKRLLDKLLLREAFVNGSIFPRRPELGRWEMFEAMALSEPPQEMPDELLYRVKLREGWTVKATSEHRAQFVLLDPAHRKRVTFSYEEGTNDNDGNFKKGRATFTMLSRYEIVQTPVDKYATSLREGDEVTVIIVDRRTNDVLLVAGKFHVPPDETTSPLRRFSDSQTKFDASVTAARRVAREWLERKFGWGPYVSNECWDAIPSQSDDIQVKPGAEAPLRPPDGEPHN